MPLPWKLSVECPHSLSSTKIDLGDVSVRARTVQHNVFLAHKAMSNLAGLGTLYKSGTALI